MKFVRVFVLLLIVSLLSYGQKYRRYPFKCGKVEYVLSGNTIGKQIIQWEDYGYKEVTVEESESNLFGQKTVTNKTTLLLGAIAYEWSNSDNKVYQTTNPIALSWENGNFSNKSQEEFNDEIVTALGFEKIGTEVLLGKKCDIYKGLGKIWVWNGLNLKTEVNVLGTKSSIAATSIKTNLKLNSSIFELPPNKVLVKNADEQLNDTENDEAELKAEDVKKALKSLFE